MATAAVSRTEALMGTVFTITVYDGDVQDATIDEAFQWFHHVEETFSTFRPSSEISLLGTGRLSTDEASRDVRHVLSRCEELQAATGDRFTVRPGRPGGPGLDPAAFVKGWSVDEAALLLRLGGATSFMIDAGGDVLCVGPAPTGDRWRVGVRHPGHPDLLGAVLRISNGAVATSGTYFRGEHIWGAGTRDKRVTGVTVIGPGLGTADALATAIFGDQARSLSWMSAFPEYGVVMMTSDGELQWTTSLNGVIDGSVASHDTAATDHAGARR